jgi:very-short-patch-repair endonuclease
MLPYDKRLRERSRILRKEMTPAENFLWSKIRLNQLNGYRFYRQKPVGAFIADFYCPKAKLVIEVDGEYHLSNKSSKYDKERDEYISEIHRRVLRFSNNEVLSNIHEVVKRIEQELQKNSD